MRRTLLISILSLLTLTLGATSVISPAPADAALPGPTGKISFASNRAGNVDVYAMNADGTAQTRLTTDPALDLSPAWSPDGTNIAFVSMRDGNSEIYVMNADGTGQTNISSHSSFELSPAWSPDGSKIAFVTIRDGNAEIYVMNADGSNQTNLTQHPVGDVNPAWSPDGSKIAFDSDRVVQLNSEIYVMNADGTGQTSLTDHPAPDAFAAWSPDGSKIAFQSGRDGNNEIYVMNADGSSPQRLTENPATDSAPSWSPGGSHIAFSSIRDGHPQIYVMDAGGINESNASNTATFDDDPDWRLQDPLLDTDFDGCTDTAEAGSQPSAGGRRDFRNFWDFYDVPTPMAFLRDRVVTIADIAAVIARFGSAGSSAIDPLSAPPGPPAYHTAYDRTPGGPNIWNTGPANGAVTVQDMSLAVAQFGHSCA